MFDQFESKKDEMMLRLAETIIDETIDGITVSISCTRVIKNISISQSLLEDGDKEAIEDLLVETINRAMGKAEEIEMVEMQKMIADAMPPGFDGMEGLSDFLA